MENNQLSSQEMSDALSKYDDAIEESSGAKIIAKVVSGPFQTEKGLKKFRVDYGGANLISILKPTLNSLKIKNGDEVVIFQSMIIDVVPKELYIKSIKKNYKLATWDDVVGLNEQLEEIKSSVKTLSIDDDLYEEFGVTPVKGAVLYGPPGCGKTLIAKCIASDIFGTKGYAEEGQFTMIKGAEILNKYVGESESTVIRIFKSARDYTRKTGNKAMIFIDEADAILGKRGSRGTTSISSTVVPTFLSEMDGLEGDNPFVLLSTNLVENLDDAITRDGRMDLRIHIDRPNKNGTEDLFLFYLDKVLCHDDKKIIAKNATEFIFTSILENKVSGAMVANICNLSAKRALERYIYNPSEESKGITFNDIANCLKQMKENA